LKLRDWLLVAAVIGFVAVNFFVWSRHPTPVQLLLISFPMGAAAFAAFFWHVTRPRD
jgi:predicted Na+-dependent transporter